VLSDDSRRLSDLDEEDLTVSFGCVEDEPWRDTP